MKKKLTLSILFYFFTQFLFSESLIINEFNYKDLDINRGDSGKNYLQLKQNEYDPKPETDLLLHFNNNFKDEVGNYNVISQYENLSSVEKILGSSSSFYLKDKGVIFSSNGDSIFSPGRIIGDFTIEFWAFPSIISEDTTMFSWKGVNKVESDFIPQKIKCYIEDRNVVWEFENVFIPADSSKYTVKLKGSSRLIPNNWNHYLLRYDSDTGLIEFLLNGIPEATKYSTPTEKENFIIYPPYIGNFSKNEIYIGQRFRGFIDELRISESFIEKPFLSKYRSKGSFYTPVYDLEGSNVELDQIIPNETLEDETAITYHYRLSEIPFLKENSELPWLELEDLTTNNIGRYIQIKGDLYSSGDKNKTPLLKDLIIKWNKLPIPPSPQIIISSSEKNGLTIDWQPVKHFKVDGYYLYYGKESNNYIEMIDVGKETTYTINGLTPDNIYYFSIRSYVENRMSDYSVELYDRPK